MYGNNHWVKLMDVVVCGKKGGGDKVREEREKSLRFGGGGKSKVKK